MKMKKNVQKLICFFVMLALLMTSGMAVSAEALPEGVQALNPTRERNYQHPPYIGDEYHPDDVAVINGIIENSDLDWLPNQPESWPTTGAQYVQWSEGDAVRLESLVIPEIALTGELDLRGCVSLKQLICSENELERLDVSDLAYLQTLECEINLLTTLDVSTVPNLQYLLCGFNELSSLNVSGLSNLELLDCCGNMLEELSLSGLTSLQYLHCYRNALSSLDTSDLVALKELDCFENQITNLDVSGLLCVS